MATIVLVAVQISHDAPNGEWSAKQSRLSSYERGGV